MYNQKAQKFQQKNITFTSHSIDLKYARLSYRSIKSFFFSVPPSSIPTHNLFSPSIHKTELLCDLIERIKGGPQLRRGDQNTLPEDGTDHEDDDDDDLTDALR
jgi:hypothetical protein